MRKVLFLGYGYVAQYFCKPDDLDGFDIGASINISKEKYFTKPKKVSAIDFSKIDNLILDGYDNFVISIPPFYQLKTDTIIDKFYDYFLNRQIPYQLMYLSATSVYGDHKGEKVQETSQLKAKSVNGLARIECEKRYLELRENKAGNINILRLAGIYGDKRNSILRIHNRQILSNKLSTKLTSRTHIDDITNIMKKIILSDQIRNQIFNIADDNPSKTNEVNDYICKELLKIDPLTIDENLGGSKNYSFDLDNKIVDNEKIKKLLNYQLAFPSYKEGLRQIFDDLNLI